MSAKKNIHRQERRGGYTGRLRNAGAADGRRERPLQHRGWVPRLRAHLGAAAGGAHGGRDGRARRGRGSL